MLEHLPELSEEKLVNIPPLKVSSMKINTLEANRELKELAGDPKKKMLRVWVERLAWVGLPSVIVVFTVAYVAVAVTFINQSTI